MKNVTVTLEEEVALWVRVRAAEQNQSVSRYLGDMLRKQMAEEKTYEEAMNRFLSRRPSRISDSGLYPARETLYERPRTTGDTAGPRISSSSGLKGRHP